MSAKVDTKKLHALSTERLVAIARDPFRKPGVRNAATDELESRGEGPEKWLSKETTARVKAVMHDGLRRPRVRQAAKDVLKKRGELSGEDLSEIGNPFPEKGGKWALAGICVLVGLAILSGSDRKGH